MSPTGKSLAGLCLWEQPAQPHVGGHRRDVKSVTLGLGPRGDCDDFGATGDQEDVEIRTLD